MVYVNFICQTAWSWSKQLVFYPVVFDHKEDTLHYTYKTNPPCWILILVKSMVTCQSLGYPGFHAIGSNGEVPSVYWRKWGIALAFLLCMFTTKKLLINFLVPFSHVFHEHPEYLISQYNYSAIFNRKIMVALNTIFHPKAAPRHKTWLCSPKNMTVLHSGVPSFHKGGMADRVGSSPPQLYINWCEVEFNLQSHGCSNSCSLAYSLQLIKSLLMGLTNESRSGGNPSPLNFCGSTCLITSCTFEKYHPLLVFLHCRVIISPATKVWALFLLPTPNTALSW